jgi:hypothetical protein
MVRELFEELFGSKLGFGSVETWEVEQKPNSLICRVGLSAGGVGSRVLVKQIDPRQRDGLFGREASEFWATRFDAQLAVQTHLASVGAGWPAAVPRVLAWDRATLTVCMEAAAGEKVNDLLARAARSAFAFGTRGLDDAVEASRQVGAWLRMFHALDPRTVLTPEMLAERVPWEEYIASRLAMIERNPVIYRKITKHVRGLNRDPARFVRLLEGPGALVHGDFQADNMLWNGKRVIVLDFMGAGVGYPELDVLKFLHNIRKYRLGNPIASTVVRRSEDAFLSAYASREFESPRWRALELAWAIDKLADHVEDGDLAKPTFATRMFVRHLLAICARNARMTSQD